MLETVTIGQNGQNASMKPQEILSDFIRLDEIEGFENTLHDFFVAFFTFSDVLNDEDRQLASFHYTGMRKLLRNIKNYEQQIKTV